MIWLKEIDTGLKKFFTNLHDNVPFVPNEPNTRVNKETYPLVTFFNYDIKVNKKKTDNNTITTKKVEGVDNQVEVEKAPICYDFYYQIDYWSKSLNDISKLTGQLALASPENNYLVTITDGETIQEAVLKQVDYRNLDFIEEGESRCRRSYWFIISVYLPFNPEIKNSPSNINLGGK